MKMCKDCRIKETSSPKHWRCDACQIERDEYYSERLRQEHPRGRVIFSHNEHSTYWNRDGKA